MASNPPFHVMEDQTDEDFFDNLVDGDFGPTNSDSGPKFTEGSDSDEAKAFANLSIEDTGGERGLEERSVKDSVHVPAGSSSTHAEESNVLDSSNLLGSHSMVESNNDAIGSEAVLDSVSKSSGSAKSGVKEVGWSSFYADSTLNRNHGFGSFSDLFNDLGDSSEDFPAKENESFNVEASAGVGLDNSINQGQYQDVTQVHGGSMLVSANEQDIYSSQYWESMYPGWKYDPSTGQWYQVDSYDSTGSVEGNAESNMLREWAAVSDGKTEVNYNMQQSLQSSVGAVAKTSTTESVSGNQVLSGYSQGFPEHMIFDPQYPGWYYDTIVQEWRSLESYTTSVQSTTVQQTHDEQNQNGFAFADSYSQNNNSKYGEYEQIDQFVSQSYNSPGQLGNWDQSYDSYNLQDSNVAQPETMTKTSAVSDFGANQQLPNSYSPSVSMNNHVDEQMSFNSLGRFPSYGNVSLGHAEANGSIGAQSSVSGGNFSQNFTQRNVKQNEPTNFPNNYFGSHKIVNGTQHSFHSNQQYSYPSNIGRSSAGRPPHALVTFGFAGKLIVMKDNNFLGNSSFGSQNPVGGSISVLNLMEVVLGSTDNASRMGRGACNYFDALCQQSFPGPLVGGNVGNKELNKWIDERIANCESPDIDYRKSQVLKLLISLLKIACQHYGKLRSPFGTDASSRENDAPESAVAKLFASAKRNGTQFSEYCAVSHCLQNLPSEGQIQATASEVQNLLVSGRKKEALKCAQDGQLWGPALVLASQLSEQFYIDTVKQMAIQQLVAGSPMRTLCLLIAGQPAEVFSTNTTTYSNLSGAITMSQQPAQLGANGMLDDWEENLAVITANRTKDDELVIIHLGDCLWKDRSEIIAAHICYLIAEANFESYSDSARMCLIGADHWKHPRTYANPEAIQRTELYEYAKVLGNSQFFLLPFQPYKLIYACMLAEVGKVSDSLKYCQAVLKSLKTGRASEVETWKQMALSLEERIRTHQQGGYATNLAPAKLVGKLLNFFDNTAHRVVGGLPPPIPSTPQGSVQTQENYQQMMAPRVSASQSTMAMSSLVPSASMEPISEWATDNNRMKMQNRSVSEPDFGRSQDHVEPSKEETSPSTKISGSVGASRFGRFGFGSQLLQKTVGLVLRPRPGRQAKLGDTNKFYYDEKLKRWVEEGAEPPAEETALPPPPTTATFQNGISDYNLKSALQSEGSSTNGSPKYSNTTLMEQHSSGIPPIPTSSNQFSARGRMGVRARYVDTFNKGGGSSANMFQSPSVPSVKPAVAATAKFFVPAPAPSGDCSTEAVTENMQEDSATNEIPSTSTLNDPCQTPTSSSKSLQRFPSVDNITGNRAATNDTSISSNSRRTASWSGNIHDSFAPPTRMTEPKPLGEAMGMSSPPLMPSEPRSVMHMPPKKGSYGDDLHEVEL